MDIPLDQKQKDIIKKQLTSQSSVKSSSQKSQQKSVSSNQLEDVQQVSESQDLLEQNLKSLLERILTYMEKFIKTKEDLQIIEDKLNDYDNLNALVDIIKNVFVHLVEKVDTTIKNINFTGSKDQKDSNNCSMNTQQRDEYDQLEKIVQKHEAEIRTHIRLEQQLKLYAESLQSKLEESEKSRTDLLESTKNMINGIKRDNQKLSEEIKNLKNENKKLSENIKDNETKEKSLQDQIQNVPILQDKVLALEKILQEKQYLQTKQVRHQSSKSLHQIQKDNSLKKIPYDYIHQSNQNIIRHKKRPETPPQYAGSPSKRIANSSNTLSSSKQVNRSKDNFKNSYQRFYNQIKHAREDSMRSLNKDVKQIYTNNSTTYKTQQSSTIQANSNDVLRTLSKERESTVKTQQGNVQYQNNSYQAYINSSQQHKRSKSHNLNGQNNSNNNLNKIRGLINHSKNLSQQQTLQSEFNQNKQSQEFNDIQSNTQNINIDLQKTKP